MTPAEHVSWSGSKRRQTAAARASFICLALFVSGISGCSAPTLKPWHTERLRAEYVLAKADEVDTFEAYLALEDALFAELEQQVYAQVERGPAFQLVRYSAGSAADPQVRDPNWNRTFELQVDDPRGAVLLLHGMSDSPYSLRALGETLHGLGYQVLGLRLPGHGTVPSGLKYVTWEDTAAVTALAMSHLQSRAPAKLVHVIGYSTGAALAMNFALDAIDGSVEPMPASLVLISPAVGVHTAAAFAGTKSALGNVPGLSGLSWLSIQPEFDPYKYNSFATNAGAQVHRLTRQVATRVAALDETTAQRMPPILAFKSTVDATVTTRAVVDDLLARLAPGGHELVLFDINRSAVKSAILIDDPAPLTAEVVDNGQLPFALTLIANEHPQTSRVVSRRKQPYSTELGDTEALNARWPTGVYSLSHVALPFPPDDPLYGREPPADEGKLFLGDLPVRGERGLLKIPNDALLRLRHNPFYDYLQHRVVDWLESVPG